MLAMSCHVQVENHQIAVGDGALDLAAIVGKLLLDARGRLPLID